MEKRKKNYVWEMYLSVLIVLCLKYFGYFATVVPSVIYKINSENLVTGSSPFFKVKK